MKVLLFGRLGESSGRELDADVAAEGCSIAELRERLANSRPELSVLTGQSIRACVDEVIVHDDAIVCPGQVVAFIPPVSGG